MRKTSTQRSNQSPRKRGRRRKVESSALTKIQSSSIPKSKNGSTPRCPKCKGFLVIHHTDHSPLLEIRCINCGWQPQWGTRIVGVSKEIHSIRNRTTKMFFQPSLRPTMLSDNGFRESA